MPVSFKKDIVKSSFCDPRMDFQISHHLSEIRYDPLTSQLSRIFPSKAFMLPRHDWTPAANQSLARPCPFCAENLENSTPRFPEEFIPTGRVRVGQAVVVPNISVYESYNGVVVMAPEHYVSMRDMTSGMIGQSLEAAVEFLKRAAGKDPDNARYGTVNWNYMPHAGGSVIHPHLQVIAGRNPSSYAGLIIRECERYYRSNNSVFWADLLEAESGGPRYLGKTGSVVWLATFAPRGLADVTAVLPEKASVRDIGEEDIKDIASGVLRVVRYYDSVNIPAFNMALYFARREDQGFWVTLRMIARFSVGPLSASDFSYMQALLGDPWTFQLPEEMAPELRRYFPGS